MDAGVILEKSLTSSGQISFLKKCKLKIFFPTKQHFPEHSGSAAARKTCRDLDQPRREMWVNSTPATDWKKKIKKS